LTEGSTASEDFNEEQFTHIGALAHKYECNTIEKWARGKLEDKLKKSLHLSKETRAEYILLTAIQCDWPSIKTYTEDLWLATIGSVQNTPVVAPNTGADLSKLLRFADSVGLRFHLLNAVESLTQDTQHLLFLNR
jgi:hypothetical protein